MLLINIAFDSVFNSCWLLLPQCAVLCVCVCFAMICLQDNKYVEFLTLTYTNIHGPQFRFLLQIALFPCLLLNAIRKVVNLAIFINMILHLFLCFIHYAKHRRCNGSKFEFLNLFRPFWKWANWQFASKVHGGSDFLSRTRNGVFNPIISNDVG